MHKYLYFSVVAIVVILAFLIFDKERRRLWLSLVITVAVALVAVILVAWLVFESSIF